MVAILNLMLSIKKLRYAYLYTYVAAATYAYRSKYTDNSF